MRVVVHRIAPRYFFGFDYLPYGDFMVPVSDLEKTLIDLAYFGESPGEEVMGKLTQSVDRKRMEGYLARYPPAFARRFSRMIPAANERALSS